MFGSSVNTDVMSISIEAKIRLVRKLPDNQTWFAEASGYLLELDSSSSDLPTLVDALILCIRYFLTSRERQLGIAICQRALALSVESKLLTQERLLCNFLGIFHKNSGKYVTAIEYFVRGIGIARRIGNRSGEASIWANMASVANMMGLHEDSIKFARRSLALSAGDSDEVALGARVAASQILARACQVIGRDDDALLAIRNAAHEMPKPKSIFDHIMKVRLHHTHAVIALRVDLVEEARTAVRYAVEHARHSSNAETTIQAAAASAMVEARLGNLESADKTSSRLLAEASSHNILVFDIYFARLYVLEQAKRLEEAAALRAKFRGEWQKHKMNDVIAQLRTLDDSVGDDEKNASQAAVRERLEELAIVGELHDDATGEHAFRVGRLGGLLALRVGLGQEYADALDIAARLHDIGKVTTPPEILTKPGRLTPAEWKVMQEHTTQGHKILSTRNDPLIEMASLIALHHHERWDGKGYPAGLKGDEIPLVAQIAGLADVFDALSHARCYKPAWSIDASLAEIERLSRGYTDQQFETKLADQFIALVRELVAEHGEDGLDEYLSERAQESPFRNARAAAGNTLESTQLARAVSKVR